MNENIHPKSKEEENDTKINQDVFKLLNTWLDVIERKHNKPAREVLKNQLKK